MLEDPSLTVGFVAKRCGINVSTLHYYESKGLIVSWRNNGNQRRYKKDVLRRIAVIKAAQKVGIKLEDIKAAMATLPNNRTPTKQDWQTLSLRWQNELDARIAYMTKLRDSMSSCIGCGCLSLNSCPIYNTDDQLSRQGSGAIILNRPE